MWLYDFKWLHTVIICNLMHIRISRYRTRSCLNELDLGLFPSAPVCPKIHRGLQWHCMILTSDLRLNFWSTDNILQVQHPSRLSHNGFHPRPDGHWFDGRSWSIAGLLDGLAVDLQLQREFAESNSTWILDFWYIFMASRFDFWLHWIFKPRRFPSESGTWPPSILPSRSSPRSRSSQKWGKSNEFTRHHLHLW